MIETALKMTDKKYVVYLDFCLNNGLKPSHGNSLVKFAMQKNLGKRSY